MYVFHGEWFGDSVTCGCGRLEMYLGWIHNYIVIALVTVIHCCSIVTTTNFNAPCILMDVPFLANYNSFIAQTDV